LGGILVAVGCQSWPKRLPILPTEYTAQRGQLIIYSDVALPKQHRLFDDLTALREEVANRLELSVSDEPIHVYLFETSERFDAFLTLHFPDLPLRRAFFVESDTRLAVYAHWGDRVAEDLRHEVAHGYLHSVLPGLPLWLDEGLAEYFEVPRGKRGWHAMHIGELTGAGRWEPDLARLESLTSVNEMSQMDYAEAWAWVHLLLETTPPRREVLVNYLQMLRKEGAQYPLSLDVRRLHSDPHRILQEHLAALAEQAQAE